MSHPRTLTDRIHQRLSLELALHPPLPDRTYSLTLPLRELRLQRLPKLQTPWIYWSRPSDEHYRLGLGSALHFTAAGSERLHAVATTYRRLSASWDRQDPDNTAVQPQLFTGFAFAPDDPMQGVWEGLPNATLILPELLLQQQAGLCSLCCTAAPAPNVDTHRLLARWMELVRELIAAMAERPTPSGSKTSLPLMASEPSRGDWLQRVDSTKAEIGSGRMEKAVLTRQIRVRAERRLDPSRLMTSLDCLYPDSSLFALGQAGSTFVAASPERLMRLQGQHIDCDALAGTAPRAADENLDQRLGQRLLEDAKSVHEHRLVVETIRAALHPICRRLQAVDTPVLKRLRGLQHLWTEVQGQLKPDQGFFESAARLHPTAAVNGAPSQEAGEWLSTNEPNPRGWYTGAGGWIDASGDGELAVLIRCALLQEREASLFAGAGITAGSDALAEYEETELKLATMLEALENA
jgi:menaquinone-specific isochorismate synthase